MSNRENHVTIEDDVGPRRPSERVDPLGEVARIATQLDAVGSLAEKLGVDSGVLLAVRAAAREAQQALGVADEAVGQLAERGWPYIGRAPVACYQEAIRAVTAGVSTSDLDEILVAGWNDGEQAMIRLAIGPLITRYSAGFEYEEDEWERIGQERNRLVGLSLELHREGRFAAAIPILLSQIEGMTADFSGQSFFGRSSGQTTTPTVDETTLAGHPAVLHAFAQTATAGACTTERTGRLDRHAILHGRELTYDTVANSTRCFVVLGGVIEWAEQHQAATRATFEERYGKPGWTYT